MLIQEKIGNLTAFDVCGRTIDWLELEWYEADKRILRKQTRAGKELALKFLRFPPAFTQGDLLYADAQALIAVEILPCEAIVIHPVSAQELASVCYEIGNKHLPLFFENGEVMAPFEEPLFRWLLAMGYAVREEKRRLLYPLRTTVAAHAHLATSGPLPSERAQPKNANDTVQTISLHATNPGA